MKISNLAWIGITLISLLSGPGVILAVLAFAIYKVNEDLERKRSKLGHAVQYKNDGSYIVYSADAADRNEQSLSAFSVVLSILKVVVMVVAIGAIVYGLIIVGFILLIMTAPDAVCGGNSKGCY